MAYKFQSGVTRLSGSTTFEEALQGLSTLDIDGEATLASAVIEDLTAGRIPYVGTGGAIEDAGNLTWDNAMSTLKSVHLSGSGNLNLGGNAIMQGFAQITGSLRVDGVSNLNADITASAGVKIAGDLDVDGASDFADDVNLQADLDVAGESTVQAITIEGAIDANSTSNFQGDAVFQGAMQVDGAVDINNSADIEGSLNLQDELAVAGAADLNGSLDVAGAVDLAASGVETDIRGTLSVDEAAVFDAGVQILGDANLDGALDVAGAVDLAASGVETDIRGTLSVDEAAVFDSTLQVGGILSVLNSMSASVNVLAGGQIVAGGNLVVNGDADLNGGLDVDGTTDLDVLNVAEGASFAADITASAGVLISEELHVDGAATLASLDVEGALDVDGATTLDGLTVADVATFSADVTCSSGLLVSGELVVNESITIAGDITASAGVLIQEELHVDGASTLASAKIEDLTSGRFVLAGTDGELEDHAAYGYLNQGGAYYLAVSGTATAGYYSDSGVILASGGAEYFDLGAGYLTVGNGLGAVPLMQLDFSGAEGKFEIVLSGSANKNFEVDFESDHVIFGSEMDVKFNKDLDTAFDIAADAIYFRDSDGYLKSRSWATIAGQIAGAGLTATNGQLSADGASTPNNMAAVSGDLAEGFNYGSGSLGGSVTWTMPAPSEAGDVVHVKAQGSCSPTNYIEIAGATIDGSTDAVILESPYAAVSLICVDVATDHWRIY